jgi:hypothetical protein
VMFSENQYLLNESFCEAVLMAYTDCILYEHFDIQVTYSEKHLQGQGVNRITRFLREVTLRESSMFVCTHDLQYRVLLPTN